MYWQGKTDQPVAASDQPREIVEQRRFGPAVLARDWVLAGCALELEAIVRAALSICNESLLINNASLWIDKGAVLIGTESLLIDNGTVLINRDSPLIDKSAGLSDKMPSSINRASLSIVLIKINICKTTRYATFYTFTR